MTAVAHEYAGRPWSQFRSELQLPAATGLIYYAGAQAAFLVGTLSDKIFAPLWPPNIVLFCALLLSSPRRWPFFIAACVPAHFIAEHGIGMPWTQAVIAFASNVAVAAFSAAGVRRLMRPTDIFRSLRNAGLYVVIAVFCAPAVAAVGGAFVQFAGGTVGFVYSWVHWYVSNALGAAIIGPFAIIVLTRPGIPEGMTPWRTLEAILIILGLIAVSWLAFNVTAKSVSIGYLPAVLYLPVPLLLWTAVRFGVGAASGGIVVVGAVLLWNSLNGPNLFTTSDPETNVLSVQTFLIALAVPILLLSAAIAETRRAHRATQENEARMALAAADSGVGLWVFNRATKQFWTTRHSRVMFDLPDSEPLTVHNLLVRVHEADAKAASVAMQRLLLGTGEIDSEFRVVTRDGTVRWIVIRARLFAHGETSQEEPSQDEVSGTFVDVTARKAAEGETSRRQYEMAHLMRVSMLGELSAGLAHELTQPMTAILSNAQAGRMLLHRPEMDMAEVANIFDDIITEDVRAGEVISRLRAMLRKGEIKSEAVDVNDLIEATLRLLHSELVSRRTVVKCDMAPALPMAKGDPIQLQQVILNLLMNAIDAMEELLPSKRIMSVQTSPGEDNYIEIRIKDCGTGLAAERDQLFQPFFTTKTGGLGIGLSICASIVKSHGGALSLESNKDDGATATLQLPLFCLR